MKKSLIIRLLVLSLSCLMLLSCFSAALAEAVPTDVPAQATETAAEDASSTRTKAIAAAVLVGLVATAGAVGMAVSIGKSTDSMARQPEAAGKINSAMMLGLVFIETAIIYALIVAILIIFVL